MIAGGVLADCRGRNSGDVQKIIYRWADSLYQLICPPPPTPPQVTLERIYNVLLFVDGGWMVDQAVVSSHWALPWAVFCIRSFILWLRARMLVWYLSVKSSSAFSPSLFESTKTT